MPASTSLPTATGSHEQALAQSKTVSRAAVVALGLGLLSALALVSPVLAFVPLLAIAVALYGLRSIQTSGGQLFGRMAAVAGLCLATFFLGWAVSQRFGRELTLEGHARQFAEAWLRLVASGDLQQAHQLKMPAHARLLTVATRQEFYDKNPESEKEVQTLFSTPPLKDFIAAGADVKFQFDSPAGGERSRDQDTLVLKYLYQRSDGGEPQPLWITVKREFHPEEEHADWQIENVVGSEKVQP